VAEDQAIPASTALSWNPPRRYSAQSRERVTKLETVGSLDLDIIRTAHGLHSLEAEWKALHERSKPRNPFLSAAWTLACRAARQGHADLFVVTLRERGRLVALAPLCIEKKSGFRILRFIADDRSDYLGFLCDPASRGLEQKLLDRILGSTTGWDLALFKQLSSDYSGLIDSDIPASHASHMATWTAAPFCASDHDWDSLHDVGPSWLKTTRKRLRRFLKDGWQLERFTGAEAAAKLDLVASIEARSWKGREGSTRLQPGPGQELLREAFESLSDGDQMQLWLASLDGKAVAFQIDFLMSDRLWVYQLAYDEAFRRTSVGSFLGYVSFEHAWRAGVREYDYLSGEEPYKLDRTNGVRPIQYLALHRRNLRGWLAFTLLVAPRWRLRNVSTLRTIYKRAQAVTRGLRARSNA
jgi:CelD/BcsL family acetyltransferase involved in cellulose biosynthesis